METSAAPAARTIRFMMEGVGARVIRGPDWKWGKQVSLKASVNQLLTILLIFFLFNTYLNMIAKMYF